MQYWPSTECSDLVQCGASAGAVPVRLDWCNAGVVLVKCLCGVKVGVVPALGWYCYGWYSAGAGFVNFWYSVGIG